MSVSTSSAPKSSLSSAEAKSQRLEVVKLLQEARVLAIVRLRESAGVLKAAQACLRGGVHALEVTLSVPGALEQIELLAQAEPKLLLGAGTVTEKSQIADLAAAGARYIVSPIFDPELIAEAHAYGLAALPGCQTPTEMWQAQRAGADFVKLLPAGHLSPSYLKEALAPLPQLKIVPTGGITADNVAAWLAAGAQVVGVGSALIAPALVSGGDFAEIERRAQKMAQAAMSALSLH